MDQDTHLDAGTEPSGAPARRAGEWLVGGGELGDLVRRLDWSATPLGPRDAWPPALRTVVSVVVASRFPMAVLWGRDLLFVYNDAYRVIAGGKHPSALGRSTREIWPEVWHINEPIFAAVMDRGETVYLEDAHFPINRHGYEEDAYFTLCYSPVRDDDGDVGGALVTLQETTAQLAERKRLVDERERALEAFEHGDACIVLDVEFRVVLVNAEQERLSATPRATSVGRIVWDVWPHIADPHSKFWTELNRAMRERRPVQFEEHDPVQALWIDLRVYPVADGGIAIFSHDVTARKRAEREARSLAQFPKENPNPVLRAMADGRVVYLNAPARACLLEFGWEDGAALPEELLTEVRRVAETGAVRSCEAASPAGHVWLFNLSASAGEGHVNAFGRDVTERKRYEDELRTANEKLREADRRKDEFLGMLSHELRNPLAPIRNALYILDHAESHGQQARRAKEVANRQIAHVTRLVDDLLDVTRIARGKIELRRAELDLAALGRRTAEDHRALMQERHLDLAVEVPEGPVVVDGDETRLTQVLGNLLHNAAKFTPAGGRVTLGVGTDGARAMIRVRDTGAGIEPGMIQSVFEPFTQGAQTLARSEGGLGLGLALVKGLVALHGGEVSASSRGPGHGTEFVVVLPFAPSRSVAPSDGGHREPSARTRHRRVLVIDDNRDAAESLAELVSMLGHRAVVAYDGFEGLGKAVDQVPDVVLCDIGLPGMDGYEFAKQFRAMSSRHRARLVAVSGYAQPEDVARALEAGFDAHVAKPPDPEKIANLLGGGSSN